MRHILSMTIAAATLLAGCSDLRKEDGRALEWDQLRTTIQRSSGAQLFDGTKPIKVLVARSHGLDTYELRRCGGDTAVCGSRQGDWRVTREFDVIARAYPGVTFYLSPGGDGHAVIGGKSYTLAWGLQPKVQRSETFAPRPSDRTDDSRSDDAVPNLRGDGPETGVRTQ